MAVEAQSLTSITEKAAEPPATCGAHLELAVSPLTLYIVRVPGSRDVFLSPLKPNDRVVHAHDVESSLYYLHDNLAGNRIKPSNSIATPQCSTAMTASPFSPEVHGSSYTSRVARKPVSTRSSALRPLPTPPASPDLADGYPVSLEERFPTRSNVPRRKPVLPRRDEASEQATTSINTDQSTMGSLGACYGSHGMTLIRRDPSTGEQWNVATISDPPVEETSSADCRASIDGNGRAKKAGAPLFVEICNRGYSKFVDQQNSDGLKAFRRRIWMDASKHSSLFYNDHRPPKIASLSESASMKPHISIQTHIQHDRNKSYSFHDPWSNRCDFYTTTSGQALRCRRSTRNSSLDMMQPSSDDISELRLNLPVYHQRSRSDRGSHEATHSSTKSMPVLSTQTLGRLQATAASLGESLGPGLGHVIDGDGDGDGDNDGADYTLGRERAGGGFAGREPKLGKLIIYPHGQQMIDLVVAANLALWWRAYERSCKNGSM